MLDGCTVLWPGAVAFTATGSLTAALTVAAAACAARFLWAGGLRATTDRLREAAADALARGDDRRARSLFERLWVTRASRRSNVADEDIDGDRLGFSTCLNRMGEHRRAALMLLEVPSTTWEDRPEFHRRLELLSRRLAERLVEARRPRLARRMLELSLRCGEWRSRVPGQDLRTPAREAGWIWLRLGEGEAAAACFLRALRAPMDAAKASAGPDAPHGKSGRSGRSGEPMDTGPYRVCTTSREVERLADDTAALGLAEAYLLSGAHRAALTEFEQLTRSSRPGQADDSPLARGRAERGRARALALGGRVQEAIDAYDVAFCHDVRGDLSSGAAILDRLERRGCSRRSETRGRRCSSWRPRRSSPSTESNAP